MEASCWAAPEFKDDGTFYGLEESECLYKQLAHLANRPSLEQDLLIDFAKHAEKIAQAREVKAKAQGAKGKIPRLRAILWVLGGALGGTALGYLIGATR